MSFGRGCGLTEFDFYEKIHEDDEKIIYDDIDTHFYKLPKKNNKIKVVVYQYKRQVTTYKIKYKVLPDGKKSLSQTSNKKKDEYTEKVFNGIIKVFDSFAEYKRWSLIQKEIKPKYDTIYDTIIVTGELLDAVNEIM